MKIHVRTWLGSGSCRITDMTDAGKRGRKCRVLRFSGLSTDAWAPQGDALAEIAAQASREALSLAERWTRERRSATGARRRAGHHPHGPRRRCLRVPRRGLRRGRSRHRRAAAEADGRRRRASGALPRMRKGFTWKTWPTAGTSGANHVRPDGGPRLRHRGEGLGEGPGGRNAARSEQHPAARPARSCTATAAWTDRRTTDPTR